jgi:hypothetical protein
MIQTVIKNFKTMNNNNNTLINLILVFMKITYFEKILY